MFADRIVYPAHKANSIPMCSDANSRWVTRRLLDYSDCGMESPQPRGKREIFIGSPVLIGHRSAILLMTDLETQMMKRIMESVPVTPLILLADTGRSQSMWVLLLADPGRRLV